MQLHAILVEVFTGYIAPQMQVIHGRKETTDHQQIYYHGMMVNKDQADKQMLEVKEHMI